jgi:hypothetical protein
MGTTKAFRTGQKKENGTEAYAPKRTGSDVVGIHPADTCPNAPWPYHECEAPMVSPDGASGSAGSCRLSRMMAGIGDGSLTDTDGV